MFVIHIAGLLASYPGYMAFSLLSMLQGFYLVNHVSVLTKFD